jgi:hypothetical protein
MRTLNRLYRHSRLRDEEGMSMVLVVMIGMVVFILVAVMAARSLSSLNEVRHDRQWERALHVAESGIDHTLHKLTDDRDFNTGEILPVSFASAQEEETWARTEADFNPLVTVPEGQWAIVKPFAAGGLESNLVYAVGYVPSRAVPDKVRVVRVEYDFAPWVPGAAILTDGSLKINGNPAVEGAGGNVHANGDIEITGNPSASGYVSSSGDFVVSGNPSYGDPANSGGGKPKKDVPPIIPRENYWMSEYDLCPDGFVRTGPQYSAGPELPNATDTPCAGTLLADADGVEYRGWKYTGGGGPEGAKWDNSGNISYDGVYYIYLGSAKISGNPGESEENPWEVTLFAEGVGVGGSEPDCPHTGGDIEISGNAKIRYNEKGLSLTFIAGRDLKISGNPGTNYEGVFASHEQFDLSGNPTLNGVVIADDTCDSPASPVHQGQISFVGGNPSVTYDGSFEIPLGSTIRTTLWLEL